MGKVSALSAFLVIIVDVLTFLKQRDTCYNILLLISLFLTYVHNLNGDFLRVRFHNV